MSYPLMWESAIGLVQAQIDSVFNNALQEIDNQYDDGISLEPISANSIFISNKIQPLDLPAVFLLAGEMAFDYSGDPNYLNANNELMVVVSSEDVGADRIQRKAWRYQRVLMECLNQVELKSSDGRLLIKCLPKRTGTTEPIATKLVEFGQKYRSEAVLELTLLHYEKNIT